MPAARCHAAWVASLSLALMLAGCGSSSGDRGLARTADATPTATPGPSATPVPGGDAPQPRGPVTAEEERVIRHWATSLRHGDVALAARDFALPAVVQNGTPPLRLTTRAQAEAFQRALPCGAKVIELEREAHGYVVTTFRLTERPGRGSCGSGTGALAQTAFRVEAGHITQWLRVPTPGETTPDTPA